MFLQKLADTYGVISVTELLNRLQNTYGDSQPPQPNLYHFDKFTPKISLDDLIKPIEKKSPPINIASTKDWVKLRANVADLYELQNFFRYKRDSQSPQFFNMLDQYQKYISKNLATPQEIDEESSTAFVENLSDTIKRWFYRILDAIEPGLSGKGSESIDYYREIEQRVEKYFANIGLHKETIQLPANFSEWQQFMTAIEIPTVNANADNTIDKIIIQPRYFEYYDEDGNIAKSWLEGKCTIFRMRRA